MSPMFVSLSEIERPYSKKMSTLTPTPWTKYFESSALPKLLRGDIKEMKNWKLPFSDEMNDPRPIKKFLLKEHDFNPGVPDVYMGEDFSPLVMKCLPALKIFFLPSTTEVKKIPKVPSRKRKFVETEPSTAGALCAFESSYTWIMFLSPTNQIGLAIIPNQWKVKPTEFFSRHQWILTALKKQQPKSIPFLAGEALFDRKAQTLTYNLKSGTVMLPLVRKFGYPFAGAFAGEPEKSVEESQTVFWQPLAHTLWTRFLSSCSDWRVLFTKEALLQLQPIPITRLKEWLCSETPPNCRADSPDRGVSWQNYSTWLKNFRVKNKSLCDTVV